MNHLGQDLRWRPERFITDTNYYLLVRQARDRVAQRMRDAGLWHIEHYLTYD